LFVASGDGLDAVSLRLCTYPSVGTAWVWVHAICGGESWSYNLDHVRSGSERVDVMGADPVYEVADASVRFMRRGRREAPEEGVVDVDVPAHRGLCAPNAPGTSALRISATFSPTASQGGILPGRSELLGTAAVAISVDGRAIGTVRGAAHWHEQHQDRVRFVTPFTYASLRGPDVSLVALIVPSGSGGFTRGATCDAVYRAAHIPEPIDGHHPLRLTGDDADLRGELEITNEIIIPVLGRPWWGTIVRGTVEGHPVSGSVNRWRFAPDAEPFTPTGVDPTAP
jgi:hypothetical protein